MGLGGVPFFQLGLEVAGVLLFEEIGPAGAGIEIHPVKVAGDDRVADSSESGCGSIEQGAVEAFRLGMCEDDKDVHGLGLSGADMRTDG